MISETTETLTRDIALAITAIATNQGAQHNVMLRILDQLVRIADALDDMREGVRR